MPLPEAGNAPTAASRSSDASSSQADGGGSSEDGDDEGAVRIDLQLPRRSLLVQFTCNGCGGRSERLVNPVAWERGLVSGRQRSPRRSCCHAYRAALVESKHYVSKCQPRCR